MEIQKALEIKKALIVLGDAVGIDPVKIASYIGLFIDAAQHEILIDASNKWNEFDSASLVERGNMLGITITEGNQTEIEV